MATNDKKRKGESGKKAQAKRKAGLNEWRNKAKRAIKQVKNFPACKVARDRLSNMLKNMEIPADLHSKAHAVISKSLETRNA